MTLSEWAHRAEEAFGLLALFSLRGPLPPPEGIEIVALDNATLVRLRALPADPAAWPEPLAGCQRHLGGLEGLTELRSLERLPRTLHACLVETLAARGAAVVVFDVAFGDDPTRVAGTEQLARAIAAHGRVVLLARARRLWEADAQGREQARDEIAPLHPALAAAAIGSAPFTLPRTGPRVHQVWTRHAALAEPVQLPVRALEATALPILERLGPELGWPEPPAAAAPATRLAQRVGAFLAERPERWRAAALPAERPILEALRRADAGPDHAWLDLYGPPGTIRNRSLGALLTGQDPGPAFADAVVFVGPLDARATLAADSFPTAFSDARGIDTAGVELAATAYANLRDGRELVVPSEAARAFLTAALGALATLLVLRGRLVRSAATALALGSAYAVLAAAAFVLGRLWLPLVVPLALVLPATLLVGQLARYLGLARWLGIYTPRPVARDLLRGSGGPAAAAMHPVSVMFTDIVGSTGLTEALAPGRFNERLNAHFTLVTRLVEAEGGEVVEFLGDGVMAYWGGPRGAADHAVRACRAALAIAAALARDNRERARADEPPIHLRIGINTGEAMVGNVGAPERGVFTVIGDAANAAQRIEQLAKRLCPDRPTAAVLVGEATFAAAAAAFAFEAVGEVELRGRARREQVYRLIGADTVGAIADPPAAHPG